MLRRLLVVGLAGGLLGAPAAHAGTVAIFYYPWYGTPKVDGSWEHWNQNGHRPPGHLYSAYYPARGPYSSSSPGVVNEQMAEIAAAGVNEVVVSWWGRGSIEDSRLPLVRAAARRHHLTVAIHLEPYAGRSPASVAADLAYVAGLGIRDVFVYHPDDFPSVEWAALLAAAPPELRVFAGTANVGLAVQGHFAGFYTYDFLTSNGATFRRLCTEAHREHILCAPSVGPGYDGIRAGEAPGGRRRHRGRTYDRLWSAAISAHPDLVTITSYNEWGEGTQIEPAAARRGYRSYDGSWGLHGAAASTAYLTRTAYWVARYLAGG